MLPSRDLAGVFCSLTPPPATYIHELDLFEPRLGKEENRGFALERFLSSNLKVQGGTGVVVWLVVTHGLLFCLL